MMKYTMYPKDLFKNCFINWIRKTCILNKFSFLEGTHNIVFQISKNFLLDLKLFLASLLIKIAYKVVGYAL